MPVHAVSGSPASSLEAAVALNQLFPRSSCVTCPDSTPECPACPSGQSCQVTVPLTCTECPSSYCAADATTPATAKSDAKSHPKTGAIAGGVVGGVVVIALLTYLVWRFCVKPKRQQFATKEQIEAHADDTDGDAAFGARRAQRSSTHTVHSIASTVLTRASNIIQIAYIPGVMNRASPSSPTVLVPPVPPIPIAISGSSQPSSPTGPHEQHFFVPGDLRDSTYSGFSGFSDRTSFARTSYAPRSSIASTIYGKNAVIVAPPQTGTRVKPTVVNLKSPSGLAPPVPHVDYDKYNDSGSLRPSSAANSTFSVGSTFLNNASAAMPVRPVVVRVGSGPKKSQLNNDTSAYEEASSISDSSSALASPASEIAPSSTTGVSRNSAAITLIEDSPTPDQGPFSDPPVRRLDQQGPSKLNSVAEESTIRSSLSDKSKSTERGPSPFGDEHATQDN